MVASPLAYAVMFSGTVVHSFVNQMFGDVVGMIVMAATVAAGIAMMPRSP
ncbi:MAG: hypothetical protein ACYDCK_09180 [Thermoplasmatota archaeon]